MVVDNVFIPGFDFKGFNKDCSLLVDGNNNIEGLENIPEIGQITYGIKTGQLNIQIQIKNMKEKRIKASAQLRNYFGRIVNEDEEFIPYWTGDKEYSETVKEFPEVRPRKKFESRKKYFENMDLEGRLVLDRHLRYFTPFFYNDKSTVEGDIQRLRSEHNVKKVLQMSLYIALTGGMVGGVIGFFPKPAMYETLLSAGIGAALGGVISIPLIYMTMRKEEHHSLNSLCDSQYHRGYKADVVLNQIKKHGNFSVCPP